MTISIRIPPDQRRRLQAAFAEYGKQARFALANTLNDVARGVRDGIRAELPRTLTVRTPQSQRFLERSVQAPREMRATREKPTVGIVLDRLGPSLVPSLAGGGAENRAGAWGPVFVPTRALRTTEQTAIPRGMYPRALGVLGMRAIDGGVLWARMADRTKKGRVKKGQPIGPHQTANGRWLVRGQARTFAIDPRLHRGNANFGVFQRVGPREIRKLWSYVDAVPVPQLVPVQQIADRVTAAQFAPTFNRNLDHALRTAR